MLEKKKFTVSLDEAHQRLDAFVSSKLEGYSKRKAKDLVDQGLVTLNNKPMKIASVMIQRGDMVIVNVPQKIESKKIGRVINDADVIFQNEDFIVINKPPGLASQETRNPKIIHLLPLVEDYLRQQKSPLPAPLILVHRLDLETSGAIFLAKNNDVATWATQQFRERKVQKRYLALSYGISKRTSFSEQAFLSEIDKKTGNVRIVQSGGRPAHTDFRVIAAHQEAQLTLFECFPKTGRSHQIRVHLEHSGFPILGDKRYGHQRRRLLPPHFRKIEELSFVGHCLHALDLAFERDFKGKKMNFRAQLPDHFSQILAELFREQEIISELTPS